MCGKTAMYYGGDTNSELGWPGAAFGGDEAEAEERGEETDLQEAWIHCGAGFRTDKVGWQEAIDGLPGFGEGANGVFANVFVHNVKKIVKKVLQGTITLPGSYSKLTEKAILG
jgi:hypothetical protein